MIRIDANIVLRFFLKDILTQALQAKKILEEEKVIITNEVIAEIIYVLSSVYKEKREEISYALSELLKRDNIFNPDKEFVLKALEIYSQTRLDFVDCLLCAYGKVDEIATFDKKLLKCIDKMKKK